MTAASGAARSVAFVFPGQGSQYVGMGQELAENYPGAAAVFQRADSLLGYPISELCFRGPAEKLGSTEYTQPALLTASVAAARVVVEQGVRPGVVCGHSVGEYAALVVAGAISFDDALLLVRERGRLMEAACGEGQGTMAAVLGLLPELVEEACRRVSREGRIVAVANNNSPLQTVIAGQKDAVLAAGEQARELGAKKVVQLAVSGPFHSRLMRPAAMELRSRLAGIEVRTPDIGVVANVTADFVSDPEKIKELLALQVESPVRWQESIRRLEDMGYSTFLEVGPGKVLAGLIKKIARETTVLNVEDGASLKNALAVLGEAG